MRAYEFISETKKRKRKSRWAAYGPGPYGGYGYYAGYSGDSSNSGEGGSGESIEHENFADGKKPGRKGLAKRSGVNTKASVSDLRKTAKNSTGEKARMAHWLANMKAGRAKNENIEEDWKDWVAGAALGAASLGANANIVRQLVEPGDTVYSIARQNNVTPQFVMQLNQFNKDTKLKPGQMVKVPDNAKEMPVAKKQDVKQKTEPQQKVNSNQSPKDNTANTVTGSPHEEFLKKAAIRAGITGNELVAFLSQCAHETMDFKSLKELGGSLDFRKYDIKYAPKKAKKLGNDKVGDGEKYKGRGYIQLTGKDNYERAGQALGLPLAKHPELVEKPEIAAQTAIWYWKNRVAPRVDNFKDTKDVTKSINPGMKHLDKRQEKQRAFQVAMK
jgi:putative chitinase